MKKMYEVVLGVSLDQGDGKQRMAKRIIDK